MEVKKVEDLVKAHAFFKDMKPEHVEKVSTCAAHIRFKPGDVIFRLEDAANHFYLIEEGRVAVELESSDRGVITIQTVEPGHVLGWSWLFPPYKWQFDARAIEPVKGYVFDAACIRRKCESDNVLGYAMMKHFSAIMMARLQATRLQLLDMFGG